MRTVTLSVAGTILALALALALAGAAGAQMPPTPPVIRNMTGASAPPMVQAMPAPAQPMVQAMPSAPGRPAIPVMPEPRSSEPVIRYDDWYGGYISDWKIMRFSAEYLLWWIKKGPVPIPIITGTTADPPIFPLFGGLVDPETIILFGNTSMDFDAFSGARLGIALALTDVVDIELTSFFLSQRTFKVGFTSDADGDPAIFRPHVNMEPPFETDDPDVIGFGTPNGGNPVSFPGIFGSGVANVRASSEIWGLEANTSVNLMRDAEWRVKIIGGFRFVDLEEDFLINDGGTNLTDTVTYFWLGEPTGLGSRLETFDSFGTRNHFYGGQVGALVERQWGALSLSGTLKLAVGGTTQQVIIAGSSTHILGPDDETEIPSQIVYFGGIMTAPSNIGKHNRSVISVMPEINVQAAYDLTAYLRLAMGYNFLYWSNVVRPAQQISQLVNQSHIPSGIGFDPAFDGFPYPGVPFDQTDYWAHGLNFSAELRY